MDLFERQAQLQELFIASPVNAAYAQGSTTARQIAGHYNDLGIAVLLLDQVKPNEFFDYQMYLMGELVKRLEMPQLDVVILNNASLMQRYNVIRTYQLLYQRDQKGRVAWELRAIMDWLDFKKYDEMQSKALAERIRGERFAIDAEFVHKRLDRLREYVELLRGLAGVSREKFRAEPNLYALAQWYLQQAVELLFGTGAYLITALALPKPEAYHDILDAIAKHGVIERPLAYRLEHLANLRNLLAYDREQTDIDEVYGQMQTRVNDVVAFADQVEKFVGSKDLS
jgi:uncharacterized protein YutE (UPF0331/DUF86 family)